MGSLRKGVIWNTYDLQGRKRLLLYQRHVGFLFSPASESAFTISSGDFYTDLVLGQQVQKWQALYEQWAFAKLNGELDSRTSSEWDEERRSDTDIWLFRQFQI